MNEKILHFKEIEKATVRLYCGNKSGTAFFVASRTGDLLITAAHNVTDASEHPILIKAETTPAEQTASIVSTLQHKDIAILRIDAGKSTSCLPVSSFSIAYNEVWETFGYPAARVQSGGRFNGKVSRTNQGTKWDVDLECDQYNANNDFKGLSGAPLIIDGFVSGVINYDLKGTLGATSMKMISEVLKAEGIIFLEEEGLGSLPATIEQDSKDAIPNAAVIDIIAEVLRRRKDDYYFHISGSPGSGKTTLVAQYESNMEGMIICDKYFIKVSDRESTPTQIRSSPEYFMNWAATVCARMLFNSPPEQSEKSFNERLVDIKNGWRQLNDLYKKQKTTGLVFIDGLDDVDQLQIGRFLSVLPDKTCTNFRIILSCTSKLILPAGIRSYINPETEIKITPLGFQETEKFIAEKLAVHELKPNQISSLARKSEGHPLYLRYLINYLINQENLTGLDDWISHIPMIGGDIEVYYKEIMSRFDSDQDGIKIAATIANLRLPVTEKMLYEMIPGTSKSTFLVAFQKIQHLLRDQNEISIYHSSFSDFIRQQTRLLSEEIHDIIAAYCIQRNDDYFSLSERLHHLVEGSIQSKERSINACNQSWADDCAMHSVNPDILFSDIKRVVYLAAEHRKPVDLIRLLLLAQRVNFRYNELFNENAVFLAAALLALNKPEEALRYVVRNGMLVVADGDALLLLQRFYESGAKREGLEVYQAIKRAAMNILDEGMDDETFMRFTNLRFHSLSLSANLGISYMQEYVTFKNSIIDVIRQNGNDEDIVNNFKDIQGAFHQGYLLWRFGFPPMIKDQEEMNIQMDNRASGFLASCILEAKKFEEQSLVRENKGSVKEWVAGLEYAIEKYGTHPDYYFRLINVLISSSERTELADELIRKKFPEPVKFMIRAENGVDVDKISFDNFYTYATGMGYIDTGNDFPQATDFRFGDWEKNIEKLTYALGFLMGKAERIKANKEIEQAGSLIVQLQKILKAIELKLGDRKQWNRAYAIPEIILPRLYGQLTNLILEFFPSESTILVETILASGNYQLGVYSEGYIGILFELGLRFSKHKAHWGSAHKILNLLEGFVTATVENRMEKNEYLLRLIELYACMENADKAQAVFKTMIRYSMGPSWYKEDQLGIINTAVKFMLPKSNRAGHLKQFAGHLHHASGEMTFQRYVKQQQENFCGDLAGLGMLDNAISYFKYLVLPDYGTVLNNAESGLADMPRLGDGFVPGARAIEEQSGILELLSAYSGAMSFAGWGLAELHLPGDERYLKDFVIHLTSIINKSGDKHPEQTEVFIKRLAGFLLKETDPEFRQMLIVEIDKKLTDKSIQRFKAALKSSQLEGVSEIKSKKHTSEKVNRSYENPLDSLAEITAAVKEKLEYGNKSGARQLITEALNKAQSDNYSVWSGFFSGEIKELRNLLPASCDTAAELVNLVKDLVVNEPYSQYWLIADRLLFYFRYITDEPEKQEISIALAEHLQHMLQTPVETIEKYAWMTEGENRLSESEQEHTLIKFLIWFLNHPSDTVRARTMEILSWMGNNVTEAVITALFEEIITDGQQVSRELSAAVLHQIASSKPDQFDDYFLDAFSRYKDRLMGVKHFMIINTMMDILEILNSNGKEQADLLREELISLLPRTSLPPSDVFFEEKLLEPISDYLESLTSNGLMNKKFAEELISDAMEKSPISTDELKRASRYIDRSFNDHHEIHLTSVTDNYLRYILNEVVIRFTSPEKRDLTASILRFYKPGFPDNTMSSKMIDTAKTDNCIRDIFEKNSQNVLPLFGDQVTLHYFNKKYNNEDHITSRFEITAYLISPEDFKAGKHWFDDVKFPSNDKPPLNTAKNINETIPLVIKSDSTESMGNGQVPSVPNTTETTVQLFGSAKELKTQNWRNGRNWDLRKQGKAIEEGFKLSISKEKFNYLKSRYLLIWVVKYGHRLRMIDVFNKKLITNRNDHA